MLYRFDLDACTWIDLEQPDEDEIRIAARALGVSERIETEMRLQSPAPTVARDGDSVLLALPFPVYDEAGARDQEVDFIIGRRIVVTVHYEVVPPLFDLRKLFETQALIGTGDSLSADMLLELLFAHLYASVRSHIHHLSDRAERIERSMFVDKERLLVRDIANVGSAFLHLEGTLTSQEEPLARFLEVVSARGAFGSAFPERAARIAAERTQVAHLVRARRALTNDLRETTLALMEARQNEIMKALTTITVLVLPSELIAFIFAMHVPGEPLLSHPDAFWIIIALMLATMGALALWFAKRRWL